MPIFTKNNKNILFIHIPKTGGTSIEKWFGNRFETSFFSHAKPNSMLVTPQHLTAVDYNTLFHKNFFNYAFCVVRNPYSRIESEYRMSQRISRDDFFGTQIGFSLWLDLVLSKYQKNNFVNDNHIRPQRDFITSDLDIFKYEDGIDTAVQKVCDRIGLSLENGDIIPHELDTKSGTDPIAWSPADLDKVYDFYRSDFELFKYERNSLNLV